MTPEQLREKAMSDPTILRDMADRLQGRPMVADDVEWLLRAHAAALEELAATKADYKSCRNDLAESERRAERLKVHAEAMAESLESEIKARYAGLTDYPSMRRKYQQDMEEVEAYRAAYPKE